jgi:hypothetical protein
MAEGLPFFGPQPSERSNLEKAMYRLTFAALVFLVFVPVSAAFAFDVDDAKDVFAVDVGELVDDATSKLAEAKEDLQQCSVTYEMCRSDVPRCLGRFSRCGGKANKTADRICSGFLRNFQKAYKDTNRHLSRADRRLFDDDPDVKAKVDIARAFASGCAGSEDEPPAPTLDSFAEAYVCDTALCSDNGSPVLQGECISAVDACQDYAGEDLETCVSLGLFLCRGAVLAEETPDSPPPPDDPPGDGEHACNQNLCSLDSGRSQRCREFFAACLVDHPAEDECLGASLLYCKDPI